MRPKEHDSPYCKLSECSAFVMETKPILQVKKKLMSFFEEKNKRLRVEEQESEWVLLSDPGGKLNFYLEFYTWPNNQFMQRLFQTCLIAKEANREECAFIKRREYH